MFYILYATNHGCGVALRQLLPPVPLALLETLKDVILYDGDVDAGGGAFCKSYIHVAQISSLIKYQWYQNCNVSEKNIEMHATFLTDSIVKDSVTARSATECSRL